MTVSTLAQSINQINRTINIQSGLSDLQYQLTSGKVTQHYGGLNLNETLYSIRARDILSGIETYEQNITLGEIKMDISLRSIEEAIEQTEGLIGTMINELQQGEIDIAHVSDYAASLRERIESIINVKNDNQFLFAGANGGEQPYNDHGSLDTFTSLQLQQWIDGTIDTDQLISNYSSVNDSTVGFSAPLASDASGRVFVRASETDDIDYTILADQAGFKEVLVSLSVLENLTVLDKVSLDAEDNPLTTVTAPGADSSEQQDNFFNFFNTMISDLESSVGELRDSAKKIQLAQLNIANIKKQHEGDRVLQENIVGDIEDADMTDVAVRVNALQVQLEASFSVMASLQQVSLVNYLN